MTQTITVYKVVGLTENSHKMMSICYFFAAEEVAVEYSLNQKAYPSVPSSALYAFNNLVDARLFAHKMLKHEGIDISRALILECKAERSECAPLIYSSVVTRSILTFWRNKQNHCASRAPKGTVMCKWIKPYEVVDDADI